jgi:carbamate kinase
LRVIIALGGNALLRRGDPPEVSIQRRNVEQAAAGIAPLANEHEIVLTHGNGPQIGLLALQSEAYKPVKQYPLDVLGAQTDGMIGYLLEQELANRLPGRDVAALLTRVEVDPEDPAFHDPSKPIGPVYEKSEAEKIAKERNWSVAADGDKFRRVVPSPEPQRIVELNTIRYLVNAGTVVICTGGGGIPVVRGKDGLLSGVEAVIDKDRAAGLLARQLEADALLMLTDVDAVYENFGEDNARAIARAGPDAMKGYDFARGSMQPKISAGCDFAEATGGFAAIGRLADAGALIEGTAGTRIEAGGGGDVSYRD